ncbi:MAG: hypothetical protein ACE5HE_03785 [Phycisphaerae bacterium]
MIARRRRGYLLLETTIATGVVIAALAVIGAQVQQADTSIKEMELQVRARMLGEMKLAELDLGLVELDSVDPIQEEDFGPRFPDFGWRLITEETSIESMYELQLEVLYLRREGPYEPDDYDHERARIVQTIHALRPLPQKVNMRQELGLPEEEADDICGKLEEIGIPCEEFDSNLLGDIPVEDLIDKLPYLLPAFRIDPTELLQYVSPDIRKFLEESGAFDEGSTDAEGPDADAQDERDAESGEDR